MRGEAYAVKLDDVYLRFGSYAVVTPTDNPLGASLYVKRENAERRLDEGRPVWVHGRAVSRERLRIVKVKGGEA